MVQIRKKTGLVQSFEANKIIEAVKKSADRVNIEMTSVKNKKLIDIILEKIKDEEVVDVKDLHNIVEIALDEVDETVAKSYREYRNYKLQFVKMMDEVYRKKLELSDVRDNSNANADSSLVTTQKAITYSELNGELYKKFFLTDEEREAMEDGYIYIHDRGSRLDSHNCMLLDVKSIFTGGFHMGNIEYREPRTVGTAISLMTDIILNAGASQYGGLTVSNIDSLLAPYAENSYNDYLNEYLKIRDDRVSAEEYALQKLSKEIEDGAIEVECRLNSTTTARGDFVFSSVSFGLDKTKFGSLISSIFLKVRRLGLGTKDHIPVLFPKLTFMYDENLHGSGKELEWLFLESVDCTMRAQYPDFLSMTGDGYAPSMYKKYGVTISRMGCVDYKELVIYKLNNKVILESIGEMWDHLSNINTPISQTELGYSSGEYIPLEYVDIWDKNGFVKCKCIIKNEPSSDWCKVTLKNGYSLTCTSDHIWTVNGKLKKTVELCIEDSIEIITLDLPVDIPESVGGIHSGTESKIAKIERLEFLQPSYDVTTESEHFYCSGVRSHNCRANLSPWYKKGGIEPADDNDLPIYEGRFNCGALSLHFPMIVAKAKEENKDFFEVLGYYLDLCRKIHLRTLNYLSHKKAGIDPLAYCEGGAYGGNKDPNEELGRDFLKPCTVSFGITALNEATVMYNGKTIYEDKSEFAEKVLKFVNDYANKYKKEDGVLYAIYGTPSESLCALQVKQFRKKYGVIKGVSDREYTSNSFHMHVSEDITPIEKQDAEYKCFHLCNGGNIMYNRFTCDYNKEAYITLIRRAMKLGYYYGCNISKDFCEDCGAEFIDLENCPKCGSHNITQIDRVCGYLGKTRVKNYSMMNDGKVAEIKDRKSM